MGKLFKKEKGITLIALVITIVVLIILAAVIITLTLSSSGIFNRAKEAAINTKRMAAAERVNIKIASVQVDYYADEQRDPTLKELADAFCDDADFGYVAEVTKPTAGLEKIVSNEAEEIYVRLNSYPDIEMKITADLKIATIDAIAYAQVEQAAEEEQEENVAIVVTTIATNAAGPEHILKNYKAYVNGELVVGTMENRGVLDWSPSESTSLTIDPGYYSGGTISTANAYTAGYNAGNTAGSSSGYTSGYNAGLSDSKGKKWASGGGSLTTGSNGISIGFTPQRFILSLTNATVTIYYNKSISSTKYWFYDASGRTEATIGSSRNGDTYISSIGSTTYIWLPAGITAYWFATIE